MKVSITGKGVFVDDVEVKNVTRADVINLNPIENMEVVLHISADEVEVDYKWLGALRDELREE